MIDQALALTARRLNQQLKTQFAVTDDLVVMSHVVDWEGKPAAETRNRLALFITNIENDQLARGRRGSERISDGVVQYAPPLHLDISIMLAANFDAENYAEGLKILSAAIRVFQSTPVLTHQSAPDMPQNLQQLTFEMINLGNETIGQIWGNLGGRYLPSVVFKIRSVMIDAGAIDRVLPPVKSREEVAEPSTTQ